MGGALFHFPNFIFIKFRLHEVTLHFFSLDLLKHKRKKFNLIKVSFITLFRFPLFDYSF